MKFINRKFIWLILILAAFSFSLNAQEKDFDDSVLSEKGKQAYQTLLKVDLFAVGGIGYGGETSKGERAFDILIEEIEADSAFKTLVKNGTLEGGMYGLFGLKVIDCDCFQSEFEAYKKEKISNDKNEEKFSMMAGCSYFEAKNKADKEFVIDYIISNGFEQMAESKNFKRITQELKNKQ